MTDGKLARVIVGDDGVIPYKVLTMIPGGGDHTFSAWASKVNAENEADQINKSAEAFAQKRVDEATKPLVEALRKIGCLSKSADRHLDDYGEIARKALEIYERG
jgi:hypothetical protein